ncbi:MAG TPA: hypothetical protein PKV06_11090 [bacterium]|nr:hypothetical protein [bacterium]HNB57503.1 hypothetical protein [bacterium]
MALSSYAIFDDVSDAYGVLGISGDAPESQKSFIEDCINAATEDLEQLLNRNLISRAYTDESHTIESELQYDREGREYNIAPTILYLRHYPITAITSIKFDNVALTDITEGETTGIWWSASDLANSGRLVYESGWPCGERRIKINYTAGYTVSNLPYIYRRVGNELIQWHYSKSGYGDKSLQMAQIQGTISPGTGNFRTHDEMMTYFGKQLTPYRSING